MRHRVAGKVLNADTQHRLAMRRNLSRSLFLHGRVVTTVAKAKATRPFAEKLVTRARKALAAKAAGQSARWLHEVRLLARDLPERAVLRHLLTEVAPRADRPGGYTRILRDAKNQVGDNAPRAVFELVDRPKPEETPEGAAAEAKGEGGKAKAGKASPAKAAGKAPAKAKTKGAAAPAE
jgi:large subunit ribosomal protein L17